MDLTTSRAARTIMLCAMYLAQGIPWGFMANALATYLTAHGVDEGEVGALTGIILVPWTFKLFWAPLIDTITIRSMGRRRPWIIAAELMMAVSLLGILMIGDITSDLKTLAAMFFIHNCFASLQDVVTDALALDILPPAEQGRMNGLMWGTKLVGFSIGAYGMALVIDGFGLEAAVLCQFVALLVIMLFPLLLLERPGEKRFPWSRGDAVQVSDEQENFRNPTEVLRDLGKAFSLRTTSVFFVFGVISLLGWGIIEIITKALFTQQLGWEFVELTKITGGYAVFTKVGGALAGGYLADRVGRKAAMVLGFGMYGLLAILFGLSPGHWGDKNLATAYLLAIEFFLALGSVGFLSMSMRISWTAAAATVFTIFMTVSNIGHVAGNYLVSPLRGEDGLGLSYEQTFQVAGLLMIVPLLLLFLVRPEQVPAPASILVGSSDVPRPDSEDPPSHPGIGQEGQQGKAYKDNPVGQDRRPNVSRPAGHGEF